MRQAWSQVLLLQEQTERLLCILRELTVKEGSERVQGAMSRCQLRGVGVFREVSQDGRGGVSQAKRTRVGRGSCSGRNCQCKGPGVRTCLVCS